MRAIPQDRLASPVDIIPAERELFALQALRGIAAWMVLLNHVQLYQSKYFPSVSPLPKWMKIGEFGVDIFFVISGFVMMYITPRAFRGWRDQAAFLTRRFLRIYPAYWAVTLPLLVLWLFFPKLFNNSQGNVVDVPASLLLLPSWSTYILGVAWTLVFEIYFYCVASIVFYFAGWKRMTLVFLWACVIVTANIIHPRAFDVPYLAFWLSTISLEFMGGMLIAFCLRSNCLRLSNVMAILILAVVIFPGLYAGSKLGRNQDVQIAHATTRISVYALPALTTVWVVLQMEVQNRWKWIKQLAWLGDRSYSTYLIHVPMLAAIFLGASRWLKDPGTLGLILFTLLVLAFIMIPIECFYRFIEKPSHRLAKHWASSFTATRRP